MSKAILFTMIRSSQQDLGLERIINQGSELNKIISTLVCMKMKYNKHQVCFLLFKATYNILKNKKHKAAMPRQSVLGESINTNQEPISI